MNDPIDQALAQPQLGVFFVTFLLTFLLCFRWFESGHPPLSNLYESLLFLTWTFLIFYIFIMIKPKNGLSEVQTLGEGWEVVEDQKKALSIELTKKETGRFPIQSFLGFLLLATALFFYTFATWRLPAEMQRMTPLVPALQSNWLLMHVSIMLLSYSSLLAGSLFSMSYLFIFYFMPGGPEKNATSEAIGINKLEIVESGKPGVAAENISTSSEKTLFQNEDQSLYRNDWTQKILKDLDQYSYRSLSFAFPLLTLGIISGAVWANEAWGSYWSWDPKETWAFITWLIFAIYLHVRLNKGWDGKKAAWVSTFGFFMVWICYLGVNLLGKGLHSYGWWQN